MNPFDLVLEPPRPLDPLLFITPPFGSVERWRFFQPDPQHRWFARSVMRLMNMSEDQLAACDIGELNLILAFGLPGAEGLDIGACLRRLDNWAAIVRNDTDRYWGSFKRNPEEFEQSQSQFRIAIMITILQRDLGVRYDTKSREGIFDASDSRRNFLHGQLNGIGGTCVSLPILYVAIGRRLGFPLKLARAWEHLYVVWDGDDGEFFNIEATSVGYMPRKRDHYMRWPRPLTEKELRSGLFLRPLTRRQEVAEMLAVRSWCWKDNRNFAAALSDCYCARQLAPKDGSLQGLHGVLTILDRHTCGTHDYGLDHPVPSPRVVEFGLARPLLDWEAWAVPHAHDDWKRLKIIHGELPESAAEPHYYQSHLVKPLSEA